MAVFISFQYRDADNYKKAASYVFSGTITKDQIQRITKACDDGCDLIMDELGMEELPDPQREMFSEYDPNDSDHVFTTLFYWTGGEPEPELINTDEQPDTDTDIEFFVQAIESAPFDIVAAMERLGIPA